MLIKYTNLIHSRPTKISPNLDFWFENEPSGNPDLNQKLDGDAYARAWWKRILEKFVDARVDLHQQAALTANTYFHSKLLRIINLKYE
jgi:hypothetical protein